MTVVLLTAGWLTLALWVEKRQRLFKKRRFAMKARARCHTELQKRGELR